MTSLYCIIGALVAVLLLLTGLEVYCRIRARGWRDSQYDYSKLVSELKDKETAKNEFGGERWR